MYAGLGIYCRFPRKITHFSFFLFKKCLNLILTDATANCIYIDCTEKAGIDTVIFSSTNCFSDNQIHVKGINIIR